MGTQIEASWNSLLAARLWECQLGMEINRGVFNGCFIPHHHHTHTHTFLPGSFAHAKIKIKRDNLEFQKVLSNHSNTGKLNLNLKNFFSLVSSIQEVLPLPKISITNKELSHISTPLGVVHGTRHFYERTKRTVGQDLAYAFKKRKNDHPTNL